MTEEGGREVVRRRMERNEGEEGEREAVRKRMEWKGEKGSEEDDYRTTEHNLTNLTLRVFTMRYYTSVVSLVQIDRRL
jgi:hypothetical protein